MLYAKETKRKEMVLSFLSRGAVTAGRTIFKSIVTIRIKGNISLIQEKNQSLKKPSMNNRHTK
jgi:hypothetical protein